MDRRSEFDPGFPATRLRCGYAASAGNLTGGAKDCASDRKGARRHAGRSP
jgi:hypothetical protein